MKLNSSYIIAGAAVLIVGVWFFIGSAGNDRDIYADVEARRQDDQARLQTVVVRTVTSEIHDIRLTSYGRTLPSRRVEVKAKTAGSLVSTPVREGTQVTRGDIICRQDVDARQALVDQAQAQLAKAEADLNATTILVEKGFRAPTSLNGDRAAVDGARASLKQAQIERGNIVLRAPFSGIYENRMAEVGDYLSPGMACAAIVELDPLKLEAELTETQIGQVEMGQTVDIRLATGQTVTGTVSFIESVANPATRTFEMKMTVPNPDYTLKAGVSATLNLKIGEAMASLVPSGVMALDDNGMIGIRYVDATDIVRFATIRQVDETQDGIWVTGLPARSRVIIEGQDFVSIGSKVDPRVEGAAPRDGASVASMSTDTKLD